MSDLLVILAAMSGLLLVGALALGASRLVKAFNAEVDRQLMGFDWSDLPPRGRPTRPAGDAGTKIPTPAPEANRRAS